MNGKTDNDPIGSNSENGIVVDRETDDNQVRSNREELLMWMIQLLRKHSFNRLKSYFNFNPNPCFKCEL